MNEQRVAELETKIAYQEVSIQELDKAVIAMQKQIDDLEVCCQMLKERIKDINNLVPGHDVGNEKPPHY